MQASVACAMPLTARTPALARALQLRLLNEVKHFLAIAHIQLAINTSRMGLHRALRQHKLLLDIRTRAALGKKHKHFRFPRRK